MFKLSLITLLYHCQFLKTRWSIYWNQKFFLLLNIDHSIGHQKEKNHLNKNEQLAKLEQLLRIQASTQIIHSTLSTKYKVLTSDGAP